MLSVWKQSPRLGPNKQKNRSFVTSILAIIAYETKHTFYWHSTHHNYNQDEIILPIHTSDWNSTYHLDRDEILMPISENAKPKEYIDWLLDAREKASSTQHLEVLYRCQSGLGHQLLRFSAVYHLAMLYQIPYIWPTANPMCGSGKIFTIHNYLLGPSTNLSDFTQPLLVDVPYFNDGHNHRENLFRNRTLFQLPGSFPNLTFVNITTLSDERQRSLQRRVNINNEVAGYSKARIKNNFWGKDQSDWQFYEQLMLLFSHEHASTIQAVMDHTNFTHHTVFGLHIRAGNGERGDFMNKRRGKANLLDEWLANTMILLCSYIEQHAHYFHEKPPMIFVGSDTASVIPKLQSASNDACQIPVTSAPQVYPEEGSGVSFNTFATNDREKFDRCLRGWRDMFLDMYMFTQCNTVVAGMYSSFTQSAPLSYMMHKAKLHNHRGVNTNSLGNEVHPHYFCEVGNTGQRMDCFDDLGSWMLSNDTALSWGDLDTPKQSVMYEVFFPDLGASASGLARLFQGTTLMTTESDD